MRTPYTAQVLVDMWHSIGGEPVEGVLLTDSVSMLQMRESAGVASVDTGELTVKTPELLDWLALEQYESIVANTVDASPANLERRSAISAVAVGGCSTPSSH
jgi:hypothetical protein